MLLVEHKFRALQNFYQLSFAKPEEPIEPIFTSGSYADKVAFLTQFGRRKDGWHLLCEQVNHLRCAFKVMDDLIDEDVIRDHAPAYWVVNGEQATVNAAAWHLKQARQIAQQLGVETLFERRLCEVIEGATIEVELEAISQDQLPDLQLTWYRIAQKESSFRLYLAEALDCPFEVCEATRQDGIAAQMLDDGLSAIYGKDGRSAQDSSDIRLNRLTYMRAFGVSPEETVQRGKALKEKILKVLALTGGNHDR